jgi:gas vesicle protein
MQDVYGQTQEGKTGTFLFGLICGAAVGAAVGLLLAPKTGAEIRAQLLEGTENLRKQAANAYGSASSAVTDVLARGRDAMSVGREAYENARPGNGSAGV